jgi:MFS transporter, UMF1 family
MTAWLDRLTSQLSLDRAEVRAWMLYDWANSAMYVVIVTAIFPTFFSAVAAAGLPPVEATYRFSLATTLGLAIIAILSPILGAIADHSAAKKKLLAVFLIFGAAAVAAMFFIQRGQWMFAAVLFIFANIGVNGSFVFYESLLPHVAAPEEMDRISTAGYALGYLGGGLFLVACLAIILAPAAFGLPAGDGLTPSQATLPTRITFVLTALWWAGFSLPLFRHVPEPPGRSLDAEEARLGAVRASFRRLGHTFRKLRGYRQAFLLLLAFLIYNDGVGTIIRMAAIYGEEIGITRTTMIAAIALVQFVGVPFAYLFGGLAKRVGTRPAIFVGLVAYLGISVLGYFMRSDRDFIMLAVLVGMVQGGVQALSRSLFASMVPRHLSGEFFGFFAVFEKFAGILGPAMFSVAILLTGSSRAALLSVVVFFLVGGALLAKVDVREGQRIAREEEAAIA